LSEESSDIATRRDLDFEQARLAYTIIESLLDHTRVVSDLIALMAQVIDEDTTRALTNTPHWKAYLDSRRTMEKTRVDVEKFAEMMKTLSIDPQSEKQLHAFNLIYIRKGTAGLRGLRLPPPIGRVVA
jgi:hypothetical protein